MSYTPNVWANGDVVTSEKLNAMEQGIAAAGALVVNTDAQGAWDKTAGEIFTAFQSGGVVVKPGSVENVAIYPLMAAEYSGNDGYFFSVLMDFDNGPTWFSAATADDYPTLQNPGNGGD